MSDKSDLRNFFSCVTLSGNIETTFDERFDKAKSFLDANPDMLVIMLVDNIGVTINGHTKDSALKQLQFRKEFKPEIKKKGFFKRIQTLLKF